MSRSRAVTTYAFPSIRRMLGVATALAVVGTVAVSLPAAAATSKPSQAKASPAKPSAHACYSRSEHAAEQLIRMHTEMMIAGLTCKDVVPEKAPFAKYQEFTVKNRPAISKAEGELMGHFRRTSKGGSATNKFDTYRTEVANEVSRRAAIIGTDNYCKSFVPRAENALTLTPDDLRTLTADEKNAGLMHLSQQPLCDVKVVSTPDSGPALASAEPPRAKKPPKPATPAKAKPATPAKPKTAAAAPQAQTAEAKR